MSIHNDTTVNTMLSFNAITRVKTNSEVLILGYAYHDQLCSIGRDSAYLKVRSKLPSRELGYAYIVMEDDVHNTAFLHLTTCKQCLQVLRSIPKVETYLQQNRFVFNVFNSPTPKETTMQTKQYVFALSHVNKIADVKVLRETFGTGLKETKEFVDNIYANQAATPETVRSKLNIRLGAGIQPTGSRYFDTHTEQSDYDYFAVTSLYTEKVLTELGFKDVFSQAGAYTDKFLTGLWYHSIAKTHVQIYPQRVFDAKTQAQEFIKTAGIQACIDKRTRARVDIVKVWDHFIQMFLDKKEV